MTLNLSIPEQNDLRPKITVCGVGGAGGNAVNNMIEKSLDGVDFVAANTDAQALQQSRANSKIQLGVKVTEGLGAGARASVGAAAAEESIEQIVDQLAGSHMCFITAGMGGGTGTGAAPIIAQAARELGVLTVGVVTKPFQFEGVKRMRQAEEGVEALQKMVDTLIIIPNQNLFRIATEKTTFTEAFSMADDVLYQGVKGVTDLMVRPGLINLDFEAANRIREEVDPEANIIVGSTLDPNLEGVMRVSVVATGIDANSKLNPISDSSRERSSYLAKRVALMEESTRINELAERANSVKTEDQKKEVSMPLTGPGLFEPQNEIAGTEFDPTKAGEGTSHNQKVNSVYGSQSNQRINEQTSAGSLPPPSPGTPSKETMERLRAAVSKSPNNQTLTSKPMVATKNPEIKDKPRFGIGSLINRMAGTGQAEPTQNDIQKAHKDSDQNNYNAESVELDSNKEKIEVPAFLRRQAN